MHFFTVVRLWWRWTSKEEANPGKRFCCLSVPDFSVVQFGDSTDDRIKCFVILLMIHFSWWGCYLFELKDFMDHMASTSLRLESIKHTRNWFLWTCLPFCTNNRFKLQFCWCHSTHSLFADHSSSRVEVQVCPPFYHNLKTWRWRRRIDLWFPMH